MESTSSVSQKEKDYNGFKDRAYKCSVPKYSFYRLGNWGPKKSDLPTKSVWTQNKKCFPTCSRKSKNNREMIERALGDRSCFVVQFWPTRFKRQERFCPLGKERHVNRNPIFLQFPPQPRQYTWRHELCNYSSQLGNMRRWPGHWMAKSRETIHRSSLQYWVTSSRIINVYIV